MMSGSFVFEHEASNKKPLTAFMYTNFSARAHILQDCRHVAIMIFTACKYAFESLTLYSPYLTGVTALN